ncbi:hypothetical protein F4801DRAFT_573579 [Xylaria longipes]|nr:hypothetical protein F4801DRAFT_573579 [Xylaria longipes]
MERATKDLKRGDLSRMRSPTTLEDNRPLDMKWRSATDIKRLDLITLEDGAWVSGEQESVYFPRVDEPKISSNIDLRLLAKKIANNDRIALFKNSGVKMASTIPLYNDVRIMIEPGNSYIYIANDDSIVDREQLKQYLQPRSNCSILLSRKWFAYVLSFIGQVSKVDIYLAALKRLHHSLVKERAQYRVQIARYGTEPTPSLESLIISTVLSQNLAEMYTVFTQP